mmetsp:Transcript_9061/g.10255  ORF Transcript_9061/g.10255 Transcript_9061/m.10255 type:complete len:83 (+) Transcript_9061:76-324(+)
MIKYEKDTIRKPKFAPADFIIDNIFLGGENSAIDLDYLKENNITHILTVAEYCKQYFEQEIIYKIIEIDDSPEEDISKYFDQ